MPSFGGERTVPAQSQPPVYETGPWEVDLSKRELRSEGEPVSLGGRAFDLLAALVRSAGELVTKDELMAQVWPGAVVEESTLQVHISAIRKALGSARGMLQTNSGRGYHLLGNWTVRQGQPDSRAAHENPAPSAVPSFSSNIPVAGSRLMGREKLTQEVQDLLSAYRVATLTGPGGIGKTALAMQVAHDAFPGFEGDVLAVELVGLADPRLVPSAVAGVLDLMLGGDIISADAVARAIGERKLLLVLDNCEHVIDAVAGLTEAVLRRCSRTLILTTSREVLRVDGEYVYRVPPLDVPPKHDEDPDSLLRHGAVQLFVARTTTLRSDFKADSETLPIIAAICRRLDGIPLAIEFAAARTATLGVRQVAARLDDRFRLLTDGRRTALPRHQTLRAALDWSYELLSEPEQQLLRRLAVFVAGFTLDAAIAVMRETGQSGATVIDGVAALVCKSLLMLDGSSEEKCWRMLETIRAYALERLAECGEAAAAARNHAVYYRDLFEEADLRSTTMSKLAWLTEYGREIDDVRAALDWSFSAGGDPALGVGLAAAAVPIWLHLSLMVECRDRVEQALAAALPARDARQDMRLFSALGGALLYTIGPGPRTNAAWTAGLELAEALDENDCRFRALWGLWVSRLNNGEHPAALAVAEEFRSVVGKALHPVDALIGERMLGFSRHFLGEQSVARAHIEAMLSRYVPAEHQLHIIRFQYDQAVTAKATLAVILWLQGFPDTAMHVAEESIEEARSIDHAVSLCSALAQGACPVALHTGNFDAAHRFISLLLQYAERHALGVWHAIGMCFQGILRIQLGDVTGGLHELRSKLAELPPARFARRYTSFMAAQAAALGSTGQLTEAHYAIDDAIAVSEQNNEWWFFPELLRIKGGLVALEVDGDENVVEGTFRRSLDWARKQGALSWELRTTADIATLWRGQGRQTEARDQLASVYHRFTEGFETADLQSARQLLNKLNRLAGRGAAPTLHVRS
jgi:predicted ATPase/DNA-binding winged helix-turn-helix (wHTH) protein